MNENSPTKRKEDRRVARTRLALRESMKALIKEKGYQAVTVEEITERANLGRTTFYLHYRDKEDLFLEELEEKMNGLVTEIASGPLLNWFLNSRGEVFKNIFELVYDNQAIFKILAKEQPNQVFLRFRDIFVSAGTDLVIQSPFAQKKAGQVDVPIELILNYFSGSIWACMMWWIESDFALPVEQIVEIYRKMFFPGLFKVLDVKRTDLMENL
jgi:AcrR family transcriptional regulator